MSAQTPPPAQETPADKYAKSAALYEEAKKYIPGGASSILRWASYEPHPIFMRSGSGSKVTDVDGNTFIDYLLAYGTLINGHAHPKVAERLRKCVGDGTIFGTPTETETELAKKFLKFVKTSDKVIFANTGGEATYNAIRMARAATGKDLIVKAEGHYHGQHDYAMISVESPPLVAGLEEYPRALPYSAGIPSLVLETVLVSPWNNLSALERIVKRHHNDVAGIIMEPIMGNTGVIPPVPNYLKGVRDVATANDALLIFDEVITGFRVAPGGAQELYGVVPDLSTWGKALGGGVPIAAVSGKKEYMDLYAPGKVSFGGTYNANALSTTGALANLEVLEEGDYQPLKYLKDYTKMLLKGLDDTAKASQHKAIVQGAPGMFSIFFTKQDRILSYRDSLKVDWEKYRALYKLLLERGVFVHPDNFERVAVSTVHTQEDMQKTIEAFGDSLKVLKQRYD